MIGCSVDCAWAKDLPVEQIFIAGMLLRANEWEPNEVRGTLTVALRAEGRTACEALQQQRDKQHTACDMQRASYNVQHAPYGVYAACNGQHTPCDMQRKTGGMQHKACSMQHATYSMQHATDAPTLCSPGHLQVRQE